MSKDLATLQAELDEVKKLHASNPSPYHEWKLKKLEQAVEAKQKGGTRSGTKPTTPTRSPSASTLPIKTSSPKPTLTSSSSFTTKPTPSSSPKTFTSSSSSSPKTFASSSSSSQKTFTSSSSSSPKTFTSTSSSPTTPPKTFTSSSSTSKPAPKTFTSSSRPTVTTSSSPSRSVTASKFSSAATSSSPPSLTTTGPRSPPPTTPTRISRAPSKTSSSLAPPSQSAADLKVDALAGKLLAMKQRSAEKNAERRRSKTMRRSIRMETMKAQGQTGKGGRKIQNIHDMQAAIKEADNRKQNARMKAVEGQVARKEREENSRIQSTYKRRTRRQTMRQNEFKVTSQLETFLTSMQALEEEFERLGKELQEKEDALSRQISLTEKSEQQVDLLGNLLQKTSDNMEKMSEDLQSLVKSAPGKPESPFQSGLRNFQDSFQGMRRDMLVQVTKSEVESKKIAEHTVALLEESGIPPPPPPPAPSPPTFASAASFDQLNRKGSRLGMRSASTTNLTQGDSAPKVSAVTSLLSSIREGKELRKVDHENVAKEREASKKRWGQTVSMFASLQDTLLASMEDRRQAMDDDSDEDDELDWDDDGNDYYG